MSRLSEISAEGRFVLTTFKRMVFPKANEPAAPPTVSESLFLI